MLLPNRWFLWVFLLTFFISACPALKNTKKDSLQDESEISETAAEEIQKNNKTSEQESKTSYALKSEAFASRTGSGQVRGHETLSPESLTEQVEKPSSPNNSDFLGERIKLIDKKSESLYKFYLESKQTLKALETKQRQVHSKLTQLEEKLLQISHRVSELDEKYDKRADTRHLQKHIQEGAIYEAAQKLFRSGNYVDSVIMFKKHLAAFPQTSLADNAQYWIGEGYYSQGDYNRAIEEFDKVYNFPDNSKVPDSLLKKGYCYSNLKKYDKAQQIFSLIVKKYSGTKSQYAIVDSAKRKIEEIKGKK